MTVSSSGEFETCYDAFINATLARLWDYEESKTNNIILNSRDCKFLINLNLGILKNIIDYALFG